MLRTKPRSSITSRTLTKGQTMILSVISQQGDRLSVVEEGVESLKSDMRTVKRALLDINVPLATCPECSEKFVLRTSPGTTLGVSCPHCQHLIGVADHREERR